MNYTFPYKIKESEINTLEYQTTLSALNILQHIQKLQYESYYVVDYYKQQVPYLSDINLALIGQSEMAVEYIKQRLCISDSEYDKYCQFRYSVLQELERMGTDRAKTCCVLYFSIIKRNNQIFKSPVIIKTTPLFFSKTGKVCMTLQTISLSYIDNANMGLLYIAKEKKISFLKKNGIWQTEYINDLIYKDRLIIELQACGYTTEEIAKKVNLSVFTVRDHIKILYQTYHVNNMKSLISLLKHLQLL